MGTTVDDQQVCITFINVKSKISEKLIYNKLTKKFVFPQVSCLWQGNHLLSVSLSGFINYLDVDNPEKPKRIIKVIIASHLDRYHAMFQFLTYSLLLFFQGHNKPITVLTLSPDRGTIYTGSHDGYITNWNAETGENNRVQGQGHGNQINGMKAAGNLLYTAGIDDTLRTIDIATNAYAETSVVKLNSQPRGLDINNDIAIVASVREVRYVQNLHARNFINLFNKFKYTEKSRKCFCMNMSHI